MSEAEIGRLIQSAECCDAASREQLFAALYGELHRLAQRQLRRNGSQAMGPTTLLHETYLNLSSRPGVAFPDRGRFLAYAARAMRGLLIDSMRSRGAQKRGAAFEITALPTELPAGVDGGEDLAAIGDALAALEAVEPRLAQIVDLKFFCGFSFAEIGELLDTCERTAQRDWDKARILLKRHLLDCAPR